VAAFIYSLPYIVMERQEWSWRTDISPEIVW